MMERGLVHVVASDGHAVEHRPPVLDGVREYLAEKYGAEAAERLTAATPRAILAGSRDLPAIPGPKPASGSSKKWFQFWR